MKIIKLYSFEELPEDKKKDARISLYDFGDNENWRIDFDDPNLPANYSEILNHEKGYGEEDVQDLLINNWLFQLKCAETFTSNGMFHNPAVTGWM